MPINYVELMLKSTEVIMNSQSSQEITDSFENIIKETFGTTRVDFLTLDYNTGMFRDFVKDWVFIEEPNRQKIVSTVFNTFIKERDKFIVNGQLYSYNFNEENLEDIKTRGANEINLAYFPLLSPDRVLGVIEVEYAKINEEITIDSNFFKILQVLITQISTAIYTYVIREHMATGLNFYDAMKNIAKIIENQYELDYIIPQIGEMVDRFISSHLIYIFLKDKENDNKYKLLWPANCNNNEIFSMLEKIEDNGKVMVSADRRIGIFPLTGEKETLGAIVAYSTIGKLSANEIDYLVELTKQSSITIQRANVYSEVLKHATLDALTGLNNRRQFEIRLKQETSQSSRKDTDLCCIMLDIDFFKKVNDTYGHAAGDCVLKGVAEIIMKTIREYDIACRYGGEEFFILLPMTTFEQTKNVAERLRANIEKTDIDITAAKVKGIKTLKVTASIGVNKYLKNQTPEDFYQGADKALYEAKVGGRNQVVANEITEEKQK
ncbi:MAG: GGDEF domain-containing protein [Candidatus Gastranaerophilaceae bacterium]